MIEAEKDLLRGQKQPLLDALRDAGANVDRPNAMRCPFHQDDHPSSGVYEGDDGVWRFKCQSAGCGFGGDVFDVKARASNRSPGDVLKELRPPPTPSRNGTAKATQVYPTLDALNASFSGLQATYVYTDPASGEPELVVVRYTKDGKKSFLPCHRGEGGFVKGAPPKPWPIYNRSRVAAAETVVVVEGEKCVHALTDAGIVATTNPSGAGKADHADWSPLAGKRVYLWPDNDASDEKGRRTGIEHMRQVATILEGLSPAPEVYWIDCDLLNLPPKGDAVEFIELYGGDKVAPMLELFEPMGADKELETLIEDTIAGKRRAIPWPWELVSRTTNALLPGTVTCICGDPGSTKSFLVLEAAAHWHQSGVPCAVFELEEDRPYHANRLLAQLAGNSGLAVSEWIASNPELSRHALQQHRQFIRSFGRCITSAPDKNVTLDELSKWVQERAAKGARVIVIDPITAAATEKPWVEDLKFLMEVKAVAVRFGCSIILVTHPKKGSKQSSLHDMAGGAAYQRFSQTVIWVQRFDKSRYMKIRTEYGSKSVRINRVVQLYKTRNGMGAGLQIGFFFDGGTLRSEERGVILGDADEDDVEEPPPSPKTSTNGFKSKPQGDDF